MDRKYSIYDKKKIMYHIKKINDQSLYNEIYEIIKDDIEYTSNSNGIFFDFNKLSNENLIEIEKLVNTYKNESSKNEETTIEFIKYSTEELENIDKTGNRLNNVEKQFLKYNKLN